MFGWHATSQAKAPDAEGEDLACGFGWVGTAIMAVAMITLIGSPLIAR